MEEQELMYKFSLFEQQIKNLNQQLEAVENSIVNLGSLEIDLEELKNSKGKEIFAPVANGIFVRAKIESEDLLVDVGGKNFVKKEIDETKKLLNNQIDKLNKVKEELNNEMERISEELTKIYSESQKEDKNGKN